MDLPRCEALTARTRSKCKKTATGDDGLCTVHRRVRAAEAALPECPICLSKIKGGPSVRPNGPSVRPNNGPSVTPCGHAYHAACLDRWLRRGATTCPTCRADIVPQQQQQQQSAAQPPPPLAVDIRHIIDMIIQMTPLYNEEFYATELASTANVIVQFLEDISGI